MILHYWLFQLGLWPNMYLPMYVLQLLELFGCCMLLLARCTRRPHFVLRLLGMIVANFGVAFLLGYLRGLNPGNVALQMLYTYVLYSMIMTTMLVLFEDPTLELVLAWISVLAIRECADSVDSLIHSLINGTRMSVVYIEGAHWVVNGLIWDLIHLAVWLPLGYLMARFTGATQQRSVLMRALFLMASLFVFTIVTKTFVISHSDESLALYQTCCVLTLLLSLLTLFMRTDVMLGSAKDREIAAMNAVLESQQKQFESSKESIALINAKVHDIKHRIDEFGDKVAAETLEKLKSSIEIYDRPFHTGSQVLDTILYSKSLQCDASNIRLSALGDASALHYIPSSKRFYLFENILDNAIEASMEVQDPEKRFIGVVIETDETRVNIDVYNYFEGEREIVGDTFRTTKKDKAHHGLGTRSIRNLVEEYGGKVTMRTDEDMFFLSICLPRNKEAEHKRANNGVKTVN